MTAATPHPTVPELSRHELAIAFLKKNAALREAALLVGDLIGAELLLPLTLPSLLQDMDGMPGHILRAMAWLDEQCRRDPAIVIEPALAELMTAMTEANTKGASDDDTDH